MTTGFAKDILPLFRPGDVRCMTAKGIRLGDAAWMCDAASHHGFGDHGNARRVYAALSAGFMPPGEPWSRDWLELYSAWMNGGFHP